VRPAPLILTAIAIAAAATPPTASAATSPADTVQGARQGDAVDPRILDGTHQRRLTAARGRWRDAGVRDYRFRVRLSCFCPPDIRAPRVIVVRGGRARNAPSHLREAATVPRLLRIVQRAIDDRVADLGVRYGRRGIPRSISIDGSRAVADDERSYAVNGFRAT
jgi:hypothetical protein